MGKTGESLSASRRRCSALRVRFGQSNFSRFDKEEEEGGGCQSPDFCRSARSGGRHCKGRDDSSIVAETLFLLVHQHRRLVCRRAHLVRLKQLVDGLHCVQEFLLQERGLRHKKPKQKKRKKKKTRQCCRPHECEYQQQKMTREKK